MVNTLKDGQVMRCMESALKEVGYLNISLLCTIGK